MNLIEDQYFEYFSGGADPDTAAGLTFGNSLWLALVTLATIGYGDFSPKTTGGKIVMSMFIL